MRDGSPYGPLHASGPGHRKVFELSERLGIEQAHAFGLLCCLWARALVEARDGQVFGGAKRLATLAGWHGDPQVFLDAMVAAGAIDRKAELLFIHDWIQYGGQSLAAIGSRQANGTKGGRPKAPAKKSESENRPVSVDEEPAGSAKDVTGRSSLILSSSGSGSGEIAHAVPTSTAAEPTKLSPHTRKVYGQNRHNIFEEDMATRNPKTADEVRGHLDFKTKRPLGHLWRERFGGALDGKDGRLSVDEAIDAAFAHWTVTMVTQGKTPWVWPEPAIANFTNWLSKAHAEAQASKLRSTNYGRDAHAPAKIPKGIAPGQRPIAIDEKAPGVPLDDEDAA
jgi:hypothetical protein